MSYEGDELGHAAGVEAVEGVSAYLTHVLGGEHFVNFHGLGGGVVLGRYGGSRGNVRRGGVELGSVVRAGHIGMHSGRMLSNRTAPARG